MRRSITSTHHRFLWLLRFSSLLVKEASSFRPPLISQELGCSPTLSLVFGTTKYPNFFFDPLQLANENNFARFREAELKHGRVAMLAVLETMVIPIVRTTSLIDPDTKLALKGGVITSISNSGVGELLTVVIACGILETVVFVQRDEVAMPGDYGTGYFGLRDKGLNESKLIAELENGRLAMLALTIQVFNEFITGQSWDEQWFGYFKQWVQQLV